MYMFRIARPVNRLVSVAVAGFLAWSAAGSANAALVITEVDPFGSNSGDGYAADWFELTNTGTSAVAITGYSMLDNHAASNSATPYASGTTISIANNGGKSAALTLASGSSIGAGQSAIFLESPSSAASSAALITNFETAWFGSPAPSGLLVGTYNDGSGASYGLSQTADMVNIFDNGSNLVASVAIGADSGSPIATFDNSADLNNTTLTTKSVVGVNGAFESASKLETGSPGSVPVPLPSAGWLMISAIALVTIPRARRRTAK